MSEVSASQNQMDELLGALLSNPSALSKIDEILKKHGIAQNQNDGINSPQNEIFEADRVQSDENLPNNKESSPTFSNNKSGEPSTAPSGILSLLPKNLPSADPRQTALLLAIKPYLSPKRAELIDGFLKFERLSSLLKNLNLGGANVLQEK